MCNAFFQAYPLINQSFRRYEGWHGPAVAGQLAGHRQLTVEDVVRSNGSLTFADMHAGLNLSAAWNFHFHKQPLDGFYCLYRARPGETGVLPDCANISQVQSSRTRKNGRARRKKKEEEKKEQATQEEKHEKIEEKKRLWRRSKTEHLWRYLAIVSRTLRRFAPSSSVRLALLVILYF